MGPLKVSQAIFLFLCTYVHERHGSIPKMSYGALYDEERMRNS